MFSRRSTRRQSSSRKVSMLSHMLRGREKRNRRRHSTGAFGVAEIGKAAELLENRTLLSAVGGSAALETPTLTGPTDSVVAGNVTITWDAATGAADYDMLAYNINTGQEVANFTALTGTSRGLNLSAGKIQVFLRATDGAGTVTGWGTPLVFDVTGSSAPTVPTLTGPSGTANAGSVTITWTGVSNAATYEMLVYNKNTGQQAVHQAGIAGTSHTPTALFLAGNRYQVFLRAVDGSGNAGAWATPLEFDVVSADTVIENATPEGALPQGQALLAGTPFDLADAVFTSIEADAQTPVVEETVEVKQAAVEAENASNAGLDSVLAGWHETEWWNEDSEVADVSARETDAGLLIAAAAIGAAVPIVRHNQKRKASARYDQRLQ